jgi:TP901 family phage tail tape measure protein
MVLDVKQAIASYTSARLAHLQTVTALRTGAGAMIASGAGIAAVGVAILAGFKVAADAAATFERKMDYVGAVTNATASEMEALRTKAIQLGQDTIYSAGEIADSFVELAKSGVTTKDIIGGIGEAVTNLGAAADIPLDTASNIIMAAVQTFQLGADQAVHVADLLAGAANASIVDVEDLGVSLKYVGGVASALGIPIESVTDAIALLGTYGIKGSTAGTSLRQMLVSLGGATDPARKALREMGIITEDGGNKFFTAEGKAKSLAEIFQVLQDATAGYTDKQKVAAFRTIFQNRALAAALDLTKAGAAGFDEMNAAISKTTAADVASKRLDNLSGDIEILRGNLETLAIENGSQLQEFLRSLVQNITSVVGWFANLSAGTQETILKVLGVIAVIALIVGTFGIFAGMIMNIIALGLQLAPVFKLIGAGIKAVTVSTWAFNSALLANPIAWIIIAIVALIAIFVLLWKNNEGFRNFMIGMWDAIVAAFRAAVDWFQSLPAWFSSVWNSITSGVSTAWNGIIEFFKSIPGMILSFFLNWTLPGLLISHWSEIQAMAVTAWNNILTFFQELPGRMASFFAELPGRIGYWIGFMIGTVIGLLIDFGTAAIDRTTTAWNNIVDFFQALPERILTFVRFLVDQAITLIVNFVTSAVAKWIEFRDNMVETIRELPGKILNFFIELFVNVVNKLLELREAARTKALEIAQAIVREIEALPGKVLGFFSDVYTFVTDKLGQARDQAKSLGTGIYNGVRDAILGLPDLAKDIFDKVVKAIKGQVTKAFDAVKDFASGLWEGFKDGLGIHSPSYIERAMWQITDVVGTETQNMKSQVRTLQNLGNGIADLGTNVGSGFGDNFAKEINTVTSELARVKAYQAELANLGVSSTLGLNAAKATGVTSTPTVQVQAGDTITLDVDWHAAPNDTISTQQQALSLLGKAITVVTDEVVTP